jgi:hypothetical protein
MRSTTFRPRLEPIRVPLNTGYCRRGGGNGLGGHIPKLSLTRVGGHGRGLERRPPCCLGMTSPLSDVARLVAAYRASGRPFTLGRIPSFAVAKGPRDAEPVV